MPTSYMALSIYNALELFIKMLLQKQEWVVTIVDAVKSSRHAYLGKRMKILELTYAVTERVFNVWIIACFTKGVESMKNLKILLIK